MERTEVIWNGRQRSKQNWWPKGGPTALFIVCALLPPFCSSHTVNQWDKHSGLGLYSTFSADTLDFFQTHTLNTFLTLSCFLGGREIGSVTQLGTVHSPKNESCVVFHTNAFTEYLPLCSADERDAFNDMRVGQIDEIKKKKVMCVIYWLREN